MKGGLGNLMRQAQEMQEKMQKAQEELANLEVTGDAGGGMVRVIMNGRHEVRAVQLDPSMDMEDRELVEDLIAAAVNDAVQRVRTATEERLKDLGGGMGLPPGMKLPF